MQDIKDVNELEATSIAKRSGSTPGGLRPTPRSALREVARRPIAAGSVERNEINDGTDGVTRSR